MAFFLQPSIVNYACSCGLLSSLAKQYFCRHCLLVRCGFCVCHEVDSHFCSNCLENIPSSEAKHKKNRCNNCFDCPSCQHILSARGTFINNAKKPEDEGKDSKEAGDTKVITKKIYYLSCLACRWTSRDVGIPDQSVATGSWPECEYDHSIRFSMLMNHYQSVVLQDKQEKQDYMRRKMPKQHKYPSLTDRTGITASMVRRQMGWSDKTPPKAKPSEIRPSIATDIVEELPEEFFTQKLELNNITTLKQRIAQPSRQPYNVNKLYPQHKNLSIKHSLRCRQCEHNVIKPEYNPGSIKYRIQLFASYHVPEVRVIKVEPLTTKGNASIMLKLINPTMHDMTITIMDLPTHDEETHLIEEVRQNFEKQSISTTASLNSFSRQASLNEEPRYVEKDTTANIVLPESAFLLLRRDESTEFDEELPAQREDPSFVIWRRCNKIAIKLTVLPNEDLKIGDDVIIGFSMHYSYVNTVTNIADKRDPQKHVLASRIYINLGKIVEN